MFYSVSNQFSTLDVACLDMLMHEIDHLLRLSNAISYRGHTCRPVMSTSYLSTFESRRYFRHHAESYSRFCLDSFDLACNARV